MAKVYLIHGFNVRDGGKDTIGRLKPLLEAAGHTVESIHYGFFHRLRVRWCSRGVAKAVASLVDKDSYVIAHSHGAAITFLAAKYGASFKHVFLINPALNKKTAIPNALWVSVFYAPSDIWTRLAKYIPFSIWGSQGRVGFRGKALNYSQTNLDWLLHAEVGHSGVFETEVRRRTLLSLILPSIEDTP